MQFGGENSAGPGPTGRHTQCIRTRVRWCASFESQELELTIQLIHGRSAAAELNPVQRAGYLPSLSTDRYTDSRGEEKSRKRRRRESLILVNTNPTQRAAMMMLMPARTTRSSTIPPEPCRGRARLVEAMLTALRELLWVSLTGAGAHVHTNLQDPTCGSK